MSTSEGRGEGMWPRWSGAITFRQAVAMAPVLIRLDEGHRGDLEELSFSAGDMMALEGTKKVRGRQLVLAHYTSQLELEESSGAVQPDVYRALLTLNYDQLPELDVCVLEDPEGHDYTNFLNRHFPDYNWAHQPDELLENMDDEHDYMYMSIITPTPKRLTSPSTNKESWGLPKKPPVPLPKAACPITKKTTDSAPPPRPPKPANIHPAPSTGRGARAPTGAAPSTGRGAAPSTGRGAPSPTGAAPSTGRGAPAPTGAAPSTGRGAPAPTGAAPSTARGAPAPTGAAPSTARVGPRTATARPDQGQQSPPDQPPPRPPRGRVGPPTLAPRAPPEAQPINQQSDDVDLDIPTIADLTSGHGIFCEVAPPFPDAPSSHGKDADKEKHKKVSTLDRMKQMGKKVYYNIKIGRSCSSASDSPRSPKTASSRDDGHYIEIIDDEDEPDNDNYEEIDEINMDPVFDTQTMERGDHRSSKKAEKQKTKEAVKKQAVKPMVRVQPQGGGGTATKKGLMSPPSKPPTTHAMMSLSEDQELYDLGDAPPKPATVLDHMTCDELCSRLRMCGMPGLAEACKMKSLDGAFFVGLSKDILMKPPFSLDEFDATTQLQKVKEGWVPR